MNLLSCSMRGTRIFAAAMCVLAVATSSADAQPFALFLQGAPDARFRIMRGGTAPFVGSTVVSACQVRFDATNQYGVGKGGQFAVTVRYSLAGDTVTLTDDGGPIAGRGAEATGRYRWAHTGAGREFREIADSDRRRLFSLGRGPQQCLSRNTAASTTDPIIDVHLHAALAPGDLTTPAAVASVRARVALMDSLNVRYAVVTGVPDALAAWATAAPGRLVPGLLFPCEDGLAPNRGRPCFAGGGAYPDTAWVRREITAGRVKVLGEITTQYMGVAPNDPALEPYFALAEELDVPVAIHMGLGPPGAAYPSSPEPRKSPNFRASAGRPLLLEDVLLRHKRMRVWVMHGGWPFVDEMLIMFHQHPQVSIDVAVLQFLPRAEYYAYLKRLVDAGFGDRIMFGSDGGAAALRRGIDAIRQADFLTDAQKRSILYDNAARFLRLPPTLPPTPPDR